MSTNPFVKAQKAAKPIVSNSSLPQSGTFDKTRFDGLCERIQYLIDNDPEFSGLQVDTEAVKAAGASAKGSIRLGTWARGADPEHKAANVVAYRSGKIVATNVPLAPILASY